MVLETDVVVVRGSVTGAGKPAWSRGRLALVSVLQFVEGMTDRQAVEAVRARIDWKYALGLELGEPGSTSRCCRSSVTAWPERMPDAG
ncbi:hypothetical protein GCM10014713_42900 [Streptomyces purpureus]|uniref:Transposase InsH N-terminal domain-containing protein n=1 Tax=Streptomyces purpureus TaxID=1951 RepID=A0A918LS07_9ACTN|nr:hypothetical protein GCM10014713_42900 [Streptomyces purpureus]